MNWYNVTIEGHGEVKVKASNARVAINRALRHRDVKLLDGARVAAWEGQRVKYQYYVCDWRATDGGPAVAEAHSYWDKISPNFHTRKEAQKYLDSHRVANNFTARISHEIVQP